MAWDVGKPIGRFYFHAGDEFFRPSLWIWLRNSWLIIWFGWQKPTVQWLR